MTETEQNTVREICRFLEHGVQPDAATIKAAMELRRNIENSQELLRLLHSGGITAAPRCYPDEGCRNYVICNEEAKSFFNNRK